MLATRAARRRRNDCRRRRDIKRICAIAAGSARIHHVRGPCLALRKHARGVPPHHTRKSREFLYFNGPPVECRQQPHDLRRLDASRKQLLHCRFCFARA